MSKCNQSESVCVKKKEDKKQQQQEANIYYSNIVGNHINDSDLFKQNKQF